MHIKWSRFDHRCYKTRFHFTKSGCKHRFFSCFCRRLTIALYYVVNNHHWMQRDIQLYSVTQKSPPPRLSKFFHFFPFFHKRLRIFNPFYPRDAMLARVIGIATCLSVCPSVTRRYCAKIKKARVMISSPSASTKTLVFWRQISSPNSKGFPPNGGPKQGCGVKIQRFSSFKHQYLENGSRYSQSYY